MQIVHNISHRQFRIYVDDVLLGCDLCEVVQCLSKSPLERAKAQSSECLGSLNKMTHPPLPYATTQTTDRSKSHNPLRDKYEGITVPGTAG